jgi:serine/threonine protein kinase
MTYLLRNNDGTKCGVAMMATDSRKQRKKYQGEFAWEAQGFKIGSGGQGNVYPVSQVNPSLEGDFVLKEYLPREMRHRTITVQRQRFKSEVQALKALVRAGCPNIVEIVDWCRDEDEISAPWLVMRRLSGGAMYSAGDKKFAEKYVGNITRVLEIARDIAQALVSMHAASPSYVHRDIKCSNILFDKAGGQAILGDFGLVHFEVIGEERVETDVHDRLGPGNWWPPELLVGGNVRTDPSTDIYLLGGVIYEALTGDSIQITCTNEGGYTHERADFTIGRFTNDPRVTPLNELLRQMFRPQVGDRPDAHTILKRLNELIAWKEPAPLPAMKSRVDEERETIAAFMSKDPETKYQAIQAELRPLCERIANEFESTGWLDGEITKMIEVSIGDGNWFKLKNANPAAGWIGVRILCAFERGASLSRRIALFTSFVLIGRLSPDEEVVLFIDENGKDEILAQASPGSEVLACAMREKISNERDRLSARVVDALKNASAG